jgi:hypothetical protein
VDSFVSSTVHLQHSTNKKIAMCTPIELTILLHARKMGTPRLAMRTGAVLEDEACHEDISIGIGRRMY